MITLRMIAEIYLTWSKVKPAQAGQYWVRSSRHPETVIQVTLHQTGSVQCLMAGSPLWYRFDQVPTEWEWLPVIDPVTAGKLRQCLEALEDDGK